MVENRAQRVLRVIIADPQPVVREGLRSMLGTEPGIRVIDDAGSGEEAVEKAVHLEPDVVLADIQMPGLDGVEVTKRIKATCPHTAIIILAAHDRPAALVAAINAGASGYLPKDFSRELLYHAINAAVDDGTMVRGELLRQVFQGLDMATGNSTGVSPRSALTESFTRRELDVLRLVAEGYANRQVAARLNLAEVTVKKHMQSIIGKLGVKGRTNAAIAAMRLGLVE